MWNYLLIAIFLMSEFAGKNGKAQSDVLQKPEVRSVQIKNTPVQLEIADTEEKITQGLSDRDYLAPNEGMLFVFPDTTQRSFWMYHCLFDIDIAYVNPEGVIRDIQTMSVEPSIAPPQQMRLYRSSTSDIKYAVEMNRNWFSGHRISVGDTASVSSFHSHVKNGSLWIK